MATQAKKHGFPRDTYALEKLTDGYLRTDDEEGQQVQSKSVGCDAQQFFVRSEALGYPFRTKETEEKAETCDDSREFDNFIKRLLHTVVMSRSIIEADNRLHPLRDADNQHHDEHRHAGDDAARTDGQVAPVGFECVVHHNIDQTSRQLHGERRNADGQNCPDDAPIQTETTAPEMDETLLAQKMPHHQSRTDRHGDDCGNSRSPDTHIEDKDENRVEDDVHHRPGQHRQHRLLGIT